MRISLDVKPLLDKEKTGIGWYTEKIVEELLKRNTGYEFLLNFFSLWKKPELINHILKFQKKGCFINNNRCFHFTAYKILWDYIPINYDFLFKHKSDIHHFFNFLVPPRISGKVVLTVHDMVYKKYSETMTKKSRYFLDKNMERSCKRADAIIVVSQNSKKDLLEYIDIPKEKIHIVSPGVDFEIFNTKYEKNQIDSLLQKYQIPEKYFLYLGTLEPRKNLDRLIDAYVLLMKKYKNCPKLVIAGRKGWLYESIFSKVQELKLEEDIIFTGYLKAEEVPVLINGAMSFVFPSLYEGFGIPPLEAMACGVPVITSNVASLPEVVGDSGILINPLSAIELSEAMEKVMLSQDLRKSLKEKGLKQAQKYTWKNSVDKILDIYNTLK